MSNIHRVHGFQSFGNLSKNRPNLFLTRWLLSFFETVYSFLEVAIVSILSDQTTHKLNLYQRVAVSRSRNDYLYAIMLGFFRLASILISFKELSFYFQLRLSSLTFLSAYICWSSCLRTLYTFANEPAPSSPKTSKFFKLMFSMC